MNLLIFAGTHAEADRYRKEHRLERSDVTIVRDVHTLQGRRTRGVPRVFIGTFWDRNDTADLQARLAISDLT